MARRTAVEKQTLIGLSILFQGLVRCFEDGMHDKRAWQQSLNNDLTEELKRENIPEEKRFLYKHYISCIIQVYLSTINDMHKEADKFDKVTSKVNQNEKIKIRDRITNIFDILFENFELSMQEKGIDPDYVDDVVIRVCEGREIEKHQSHYLIDLPLNCYFFDNPFCALEFAAFASRRGIIRIPHLSKKLDIYPNGTSLLVLALYREMIVFFDAIIKITKADQIIEDLQTTITLKSQRDCFGNAKNLPFFKIPVSDLRFRIYRELAKEIIDERGNKERIEHGFFLSPELLKPKHMTGCLDYAVEGMSFDIFEAENIVKRANALVAVLSAQIMKINDHHKIIYISNEKSGEKSDKPTKLSVADHINITYAMNKYGLKSNASSIYRQYLKLKYKKPNRITDNWNAIAYDETILDHGGWLLKQSLVGNLEYVEWTREESHDKKEAKGEQDK